MNLEVVLLRPTCASIGFWSAFGLSSQPVISGSRRCWLNSGTPSGVRQLLLNPKSLTPQP